MQYGFLGHNLMHHCLCYTLLHTWSLSHLFNLPTQLKQYVSDVIITNFIVLKIFSVWKSQITPNVFIFCFQGARCSFFFLMVLSSGSPVFLRIFKAHQNCTYCILALYYFISIHVCTYFNKLLFPIFKTKFDWVTQSNFVLVFFFYISVVCQELVQHKIDDVNLSELEVCKV